MFTQEAVTLIHENSAGIARSINVICDNALLSAMALGRRLVDRAIVIEVCARSAVARDAVRPGARAACASPRSRDAEPSVAPEAPAEPDSGPIAGPGALGRRAPPLRPGFASLGRAGVQRDLDRMSRIDKALRVWEDSSGVDRSDAEVRPSDCRIDAE